MSDSIALSQKEWVQHIARMAGWTGKIVIVPDDQLPDPLKLPYNFGQNWTIDATRFRAATGFSGPFTLEESLRRTICWHRENPPQVSAEHLERWRQEDQAEESFLGAA